MDIQAYIQSGIIESYVLGLASAEEIAEVDTLRLQYPEVEQAIDEFSIMLEKQALENAVEPPNHVKAAIMEAVKLERPAPVLPIDNADSDSAQVVYITFRKWRIVAAASIILLISSAALNFYQYDKYDHLHERFVAMQSERSTLVAQNQIYQTKLNDWQSASRMMADSDMAMIKMKDPAGKSANVVTVFWNKHNKEVYIMPNRLPQPQAGKQYQLWALVDGKPVDAGIIDPNCTGGTCKMKTIARAQAFAITLENEGGSPTPNLKALSVMGTV